MIKQTRRHVIYVKVIKGVEKYYKRTRSTGLGGWR